MLNTFCLLWLFLVSIIIKCLYFSEPDDFDEGLGSQGIDRISTIENGLPWGEGGAEQKKKEISVETRELETNNSSIEAGTQNTFD